MMDAATLRARRVRIIPYGPTTGMEGRVPFKKRDRPHYYT